MNIKLDYEDSFRIYGDSEKNNFIDISQENFEGIGIGLFPYFHYIEIRKHKNGNLKMFCFKKKSHKKDCDFGSYQDAEVIFSLNETNYNK